MKRPAFARFRHVRAPVKQRGKVFSGEKTHTRWAKEGRPRAPSGGICVASNLRVCSPSADVRRMFSRPISAIIEINRIIPYPLAL